MELVLVIGTLLVISQTVASSGELSSEEKLKKLFPEMYKREKDDSSDEKDLLKGEGDCECIPISKCGDFGANIVQLKSFGCGGDYMDTCCFAPIKEKPPEEDTREEIFDVSTCGKRNVKGIKIDIKGGDDGESQFGEFPWMVAISKWVEDDTGRYLDLKCGGSIIHEKVVLTAAHCVSGVSPGNLLVRAGEWDMKHKKEPYPHQNRNVSRIIVNRGFFAAAGINNIALLILEKPFKFEPHIYNLCLPKARDVVIEEKCVASGWGLDVDGQKQHILKSIELPIVPKNDCLKALRKTQLGERFQLHQSLVCAGGVAGKDTCKGDGGGPLACPIKNKPGQYQQVGIVSWGVNCGQEWPGGYTNVALFRKWIDDQMEELQFIPKYDYN